ncbi:MAG: hypothetical protein Ta2B_09360 [Termitinemataceae bacterium]|nr:MAG: hypothetical protein Ta2B_09360 [Termitinemataceae bacterium]
MTRETFNKTKFAGGSKAVIDGKEYLISTVDFETGEFIVDHNGSDISFNLDQIEKVVL